MFYLNGSTKCYCPVQKKGGEANPCDDLKKQFEGVCKLKEVYETTFENLRCNKEHGTQGTL